MEKIRRQSRRGSSKERKAAQGGELMFFADFDASLPIELAVIRLASAVETEAEKQNLIAAWRLCLQHGPSSSRRKIKKTAAAPPAPFAADSAAVPARRIVELEPLQG